MNGLGMCSDLESLIKFQDMYLFKWVLSSWQTFIKCLYVLDNICKGTNYTEIIKYDKGLSFTERKLYD